MYVLHIQIQQSSMCEQKTDMDLWHRLGHLSAQQVKQIVHKELVSGMKLPNSGMLPFCEGCVEYKIWRKPLKSVREIRSKCKLELVHSDVCGPIHIESFSKKKCFVTFIDDYSRCCTAHFVRQKLGVLEKFKEYEALVTNDCHDKICTLRCDHGGEYTSKELESYLKSKGICCEQSIVYLPKQYGISKRFNRTLVELAHTMIAHVGLPSSYWPG